LARLFWVEWSNSLAMRVCIHFRRKMVISYCWNLPPDVYVKMLEYSRRAITTKKYRENYEATQKLY